MTRRNGDFRRILGNGLWSAGQQGLLTGLNAVIGIALIVAVPVSEFGIYSYAMALCAIGNSIMTAGLNGLAVKELIADRERNAAIMTALMIVREIFAVAGFVVIALISLTSGDALSVAATMLASLALFARALDAPEAWFLSHLRSRKTAEIRIVVAVVLFVARLLLLVFFPNIWLLLVIFVTESLISTAVIITRYLKSAESPGLMRPSWREIRRLTTSSWPLMLSGIANQVNLKGSVIVVQALMGATAVGVYSAAVRLSELTFFLPVVFMNSTLPVLLKTREQYGPNSVEYRSMMQRSYDQACWAGVLVALLMATAGTAIIHLFFGDVYSEAIPILVIQLAACPFVFMAAVFSKWIIAEGTYWASLIRHALGAAINIALNITLLPIFGLTGAAFATVASYVAASFLAAFIWRSSRKAGVQMSLALIAPVRYAVRYVRAAQDR